MVKMNKRMILVTPQEAAYADKYIALMRYVDEEYVNNPWVNDVSKIASFVLQQIVLSVSGVDDDSI